MKDYIAQTAQFSILNAAVERANFNIDGEGPYTFFAPNNDAWEALMTNNGWASINDASPAVLNTILKFQFSDVGAYNADQFTNNFQITIQFQSKKVYIDLSDPSNPRVVAGLTSVGIVGSEYSATNGVIHEIDGVLLF